MKTIKNLSEQIYYSNKKTITKNKLNNIAVKFQPENYDYRELVIVDKYNHRVKLDGCYSNSLKYFLKIVAEQDKIIVKDSPNISLDFRLNEANRYLEMKKYAYFVTIDPDAKFLDVSSKDKDSFSKKYLKKDLKVNYREIAKNYDGVRFEKNAMKGVKTHLLSKIYNFEYTVILNSVIMDVERIEYYDLMTVLNKMYNYHKKDYLKLDKDLLKDIIKRSEKRKKTRKNR